MLKEYTAYQLKDGQTDEIFSIITKSSMELVKVYRNGKESVVGWNEIVLNLDSDYWSIEVEGKTEDNAQKIGTYSRYKIVNAKKNKSFNVITRGESDLIMVGYLDEDGEINVNTYAWSSVLGMLVNGVWIIEKQLATF
ncbi:hypothetical protein P4493_06295 [Bacillus thuringiensis]|jgi:hypothetical protein|uniref:Uncharacterized protein n=3 Tax=Bacillus thuringiensis TaxID=1428 RepID=A0A0B5NLK3_BACTU|nr:MULTISPECIES: hypothetical protein [Bacillus]EAO56513.1 hypothetical protein RBTH_07079 [Bacillus thuringiensis serovar israelensis ATCC 35646]MEC2533173.1 hypothetical protein [Bacillus cereus]MED1153845.1 hypothetical protein [Bacillus paranthracis]OUB09299.1 hypothetical protein BK708_32750 [Bacillus thuringiensis serovar yunnanensis]AFQ30157.1 hypothetical protein BTF1_30282 [Bacillus thuringiensis HD-789]